MVTALRHQGPVLLVLGLAASAHAQTRVLTSPDGRRRVTAVQTSTPIAVDGRLDEDVWSRARPARDFVQAEPHEGQPATEATEVRIAFDAQALYVGVTCHDRDPSRLIVNDIRKDFAPDDQDSFEVMFDTFADRRNGFVFVTNPRGAKSDTQMSNEGRDVNPNWDAVWTVAARIDDGGWTAELRIPFKTLRFESSARPVWGINFARRIRRKNEIVYWSPVPRAYSIYRASLDGNLQGLPAGLNPGRNLRIKPSVTGGTTRATGGSGFTGDAQVGLDLKYGVTPALTLDVTVNPDFAQVEADEQQVNLTQFSLFYPEKREFFLENSGIFYFGDIPRNRRAVTRFRPPEEELLLFFSRRIGLTDDGQQIPIYGGGRVTGIAGGFGVGVMTMQTEAQNGLPSTNYSVVRARHNVLQNSDVGAIFLQRQSTGSGDFNRVGGIDANFRFGALSVNSFLAKSDTPGQRGRDWTGKGSIGWEDDTYHFQYSFLSIGDNFRDDIGFVRRTGIRKQFVDSGVHLRPEWLRRHRMREIHPHARLNYYTDSIGVKVTTNDHIGTSLHLENGAVFEVAVNPRFERLTSDFDIRPDVTIPPGAYGWNEYQLVAESDHSRVLSASLRYTGGGFWSGTQQTVNTALTFKPSYRLLVDFGLQRNDITLHVPEAHFVTTLAQLRAAYSFSTRMFLDSLLQYNTSTNQFNANVRFNLIHHPLSDLYVVYNEQQSTVGEVTPGRAFIVKYSHMVSF